MRSLREESGFSMPELLIASVVMVVVLSATLSVLDAASGNARRNEQLNEQQERARAAIDFLARDLRGIAASGPSEPAIEPLRNEPYDIVFRSVDPLGVSANEKRVHRVRYCLDQSTSSTASLWRQVQTWSTPSAPPISATRACPASAYGSQRILAESVVNRRDGLDRPVFTYDSADSANVSSVGARLFVDLEVDKRPPEVALASSVFLRNQNLGTRNRAPTAQFTASPQPGGAMLDGGASSDPDGQTLRFQWFVDGSAVEGATGPIYQYSGPPGARSFSLRVTDPGNLTGTAERTVAVL